MLITPKFRIDQNENEIILSINVPYIRVSSTEVVVLGKDFSFFCKPYLLKLNFPGELEDGEEENYTMKYDPDNNNGTLIITLYKRNKGELFPDLDLFTKLLQVRNIQRLEKGNEQEGRLLEVLNSENFDGDSREDTNTEKNNEINNIGENIFIKTEFPYGFNKYYQNLLKNLRETMFEMIEIENPEALDPRTRRLQRIARENQLFDPQRYLGDLYCGEEDPIYEEGIKFEPFYIKYWDSLKSNSSKIDKWELRNIIFSEIEGFSEVEQDVLVNKVKNKEYLIPSKSMEERALFLGLIDILFAFCYDYRLTSGEFNVESPYNITKLSPTLSWLEDYFYFKDSLIDVLKFSMRRLLVYPYLRMWKLGRKILADVSKIILFGKRSILKCLIKLYNLYEHTDTHYLLNKLYIMDYIVWLQSVSNEDLYSFGLEYNNAKTSLEKEKEAGKDTAGFYLLELESWAKENELDESAEIPSTLLQYDSLISSNDKFHYLQSSIDETIIPASFTTLNNAKKNNNIIPSTKLDNELHQPVTHDDISRLYQGSCLYDPQTRKVQQNSSKKLIEIINSTEFEDDT